MAQIKIKQILGASQGSILFLGTNSTISEDFNSLNWNQSNKELTVMGTVSTDSLIITNGAQSGYILTSDSNGLASWTSSNLINGVDGEGTINKIPKFVGSSDIDDSIISETSGVVRIESTGNVATPVLTLNDPAVGFYGVTGSLSLSVNGVENIRFSDNQVDIVDNLEVGLSTTTTGLATPTLSVTASATIQNYQSFVRVVTSGSNITLTLPSPNGSTPTPRDGQILTVFRQGDATSDVFLRTNFIDGIIRSGSALTADSIKIPAIEQNFCLTIQYIDAIGKWIVVSVSPDVSIAYESTL
jgi:hypothetical protein